VQETPKKNYRITGVLMCLLGAGATAYLIYVYQTGNSLQSLGPILAALGWIYGIAVLIEPRLAQVQGDDPALLPYRRLAIGIAVIGAIVGLVIRYSIFQDWK
jgi:hypothetical protein